MLLFHHSVHWGVSLQEIGKVLMHLGPTWESARNQVLMALHQRLQRLHPYIHLPSKSRGLAWLTVGGYMGDMETWHMPVFWKHESLSKTLSSSISVFGMWCFPNRSVLCITLKYCWANWVWRVGFGCTWIEASPKARVYLDEFVLL